MRYPRTRDGMRWLGTRRMWILVVGGLALGAALLLALGARIQLAAWAEVPVASIAGPAAIAPGEVSRYRVFVRDARFGEPLVGARVAAHLTTRRDAHESFDRAVTDGPRRTDADGVAYVDVRPPLDLPSGHYVLRFRVSGPRNQGETTLRVKLGATAGSPRSFVSTDKPTYQPGQVVHLRSLTLSDTNGKPAAGWSGTIEIRDPKGNKVFKRTGSISDHGLLSADFELADPILLGEYTAVVRVEDRKHETRFRVERYTLPTFRVELATDKRSYLSSDRLEGTVRATYLFGKPVAGAEVHVALSAAPAWRDSFLWVKGKTDDAGRFRFSRPLGNLSIGEQPTAISVDASVTAPNGDEQSRSLRVPVAAGALSIEVVPERARLIPDLEQQLYVVTRRPDGSPAPATVKIEPGSIQTRTSSRGIASVPLTPPSGTKKWTITAIDGDGRTGEVSFEPAFDDPSSALLLRTDRTLYRSGESIRVTALSAHRNPGSVRVNLLHHRQVVSYATSDDAAGRWTLSLAVPPGIYGTVALVAGRVELQPEYGWRGPDAVRWVQLARGDDLVVRVNAHRPRYGPAQTARLDFQVSAQHGGPMAAALGLAAVDEAVFARLEKRPDLERLFFRVPDLVRPDELPSWDRPAPWTPEQKRTLLDPSPEAELARAALLAAVPAHGTRPSWEGASASDVHQQIFERVHASRRVLAFVATAALLVAYAVMLLLLVAYGVRHLIRAAPVEGATQVDRLAHRHALAWVMRAWLGALYLPALAFGCCALLLVVGLRWQGEGALALTLIVFVLTTLACTLALSRSVRRARATALSPTLPAFRKLLRLLPPACMLGNLGAMAVLFASNTWLWKTLPGYHQMIGWLAVLVTLGLGQLVVGVLSAARSAPGGRPGRRSLLWLLVSRPLIAGLPLTLVLIGAAVYDGLRRHDRHEAMELEHAAAPVVARGQMWADSTEPWGRDDSLAATGAGADAPTATARIRHYFPETLLWMPEVVTDARGRARIEVPLADSITTWRLAASAVTTAGQLGSTTTGIEVFQPFFVDAVLPVALTQHDEVTVPVSVYSYVDEPQTVALDIATADWFELTGEPAAELVVEPRQVVRTDVRLRALTAGQQQLTIRAATPTVADAVRRAVFVHPDGRAVTQVINRRLSDRARFDLDVSDDAIAGVGELSLKIYPSPFSQLSEGLEGIFRMPYGCFEQTSSTTYPSVLALAFLERSGRARPDVARQARRFIDLGYQRLLSFEVPQGGFSLFGKPPAHPALTAYGLLQFSDMARVRHVDPALLARTRSWLYGQQSPDGWFELRNDEGARSTGPEGRYRLTAYVAWALAESGQRDPKLEKALARLLSQSAPARNDAYLQALVANALVAAGRADDARALLTRLDQSATQVEGLAHWEPAGHGVFWSGGAALAVETTALAAQAMLRAKAHLGTARFALRWLASQRDDRGTWRTTQATVQALRAMLMDDRALPAGQQLVAVRIAGQPVETLRISPDQRDVLQRLDLREHQQPGLLPIELELQGGGELDVQLLSTHYVPWTAGEGHTADGPLSLDVRYGAKSVAQGKHLRCELALDWKRAEPASMLVVQLGRPPGFDVVRQDLERLVGENQIARHELGVRTITLYLHGLSSERPFRASFRLLAQQRAEVQTPPSQAYLYYEPDVHAAAPPVTLRVR